MNNKYNLQVGDVFKMYSSPNDFTITYFGEKGILFNDETYYWSLTETNKLIDKGNWKIKSRVKDMKVEAPKTFLVKGDSKHLLKACLDEILELGYEKCKLCENREPERFFSCNIIQVGDRTTLENYKEIYINNDLTKTEADITFTLPQNYTKAIEHAKESINSPYWTQSKVKKMKFGSLEVEVTPGLGYVQIAEGKVTKEDLKRVYDWFTNTPKILGYNLTANFNNQEIAFGCKKGTVQQILDIYHAM